MLVLFPAKRKEYIMVIKVIHNPTKEEALAMYPQGDHPVQYLVGQKPKPGKQPQQPVPASDDQDTPDFDQ
jgi:hypothetical protein